MVGKVRLERTKLSVLEQQGMAFVCLSQDPDTLKEIQQVVDDPDITAAQFKTENGDYDSLYVRYGTPSFRASTDDWYKVIIT